MINNFTPFPNLETDRLILRQIEENDKEAIFEYQSNKENFVHVEMPVYKTVSEAEAYIEKNEKMECWTISGLYGQLQVKKQVT